MFQHGILTSLGSTFDEQQWVVQIRRALEEELEEEIQILVTIFGVPKALMSCDPDSYIPQLVAMGPYHHLRMELYDMERYKVAAAKRINRELHNVNLSSLVDKLMKHEIRIRACYHRPISFGREALAWMMAVDVSFMFEFIRVCGIKQGKLLGKIPSGLSHLVDASGNKATHNSILRDLLMLENQIPLFVMRMMLEQQFSSVETADQFLLSVLTELSKDLSPFKAVKCSEMVPVKECAHLLEFLYHFIVPKCEVLSFASLEIKAEFGDEEKGKSVKKDSFSLLSSLKEGTKRVIFSKPVKCVVNMPWTVLGKIPIIKVFKGLIDNILGTLCRKYEEEKSPLLEEIAIPSVTQLLDAGVQFVATKEGISSIKFDEKSLKFYFPIINLDVNSKVVLRNLVAYEACSSSVPLILTRYTELMNGIIDTEEDVKYLCGKGIIVNHLKSEEEAADLWNGMSKSVRLAKVASLDKVIADVNRFYGGRWSVKMGKFMSEYVFGSWKILTFIAAMFMLWLMFLQDFCEIYACSRIIPIKALQPTAD